MQEYAKNGHHPDEKGFAYVCAAATQNVDSLWPRSLQERLSILILGNLLPSMDE